MEASIQVLHQFCNEIIEFVDDLKKSGKIEKITIIFATPKPTEYKFEKGHHSCSYATITEERQEWPKKRVAIDRYNDALLKPFQEEQILSYGVMALEALFLEASGQGELRYKLANRVGQILSFIGKDGVLTSDKIKDSYVIRSKFVHGGYIRSRDRTKMYELTNEVMEYARLSLLIMVQLQKEISKDDCLKILDNSLLSVSASDKLENLIKSNCLVTFNTAS